MYMGLAKGVNQQGPAAVEPDNLGHPEPSTLPFTYVVIAIAIAIHRHSHNHSQTQPESFSGAATVIV